MSIRTFEIIGEKIILHKINSLLVIPLFSAIYMVLNIGGILRRNLSLQSALIFSTIMLILGLYLYFRVPTNIEIDKSEIQVFYRYRTLKYDISKISSIDISQIFPRKGYEGVMESILMNREDINIDMVPTEINIMIAGRNFRVYFGRMSYTTITPILSYFDDIFGEASKQKLKISGGFAISWKWHR